MAPGTDCAAVYVLGVAGSSGSGKTTLVERLLPRLVEGRELGGRDGAEPRRVATVKSIHHDVEVDEPGKDTHRHREAGAEATVGVTPARTFGFAERGKSSVPEESAALEPVLSGFADRGVDYALVEGFASSWLPKVVVGSVDGDDGGRRDVAEPVVARVDDAKSADLEELVGAVSGLRGYETLASALERHRRSGTASAVAVVSAGSNRLADPTDWTHGRIPESLAPSREALADRSGVDSVAVHLRPPVSSGGEAAVHVVVGADDAQTAFAAASDAGDRLADSSAVDGPVEYLLREG